MATLYRDTGYALSNLIEDIRRGRLALPDIQRPFVWSAAKTRDLFDSMYRGFPIGTLMFWETGAEVGTRQVGLSEAEKAPQLLIVDGQQRLTSLYAVLTGELVLTKTFERRKIRIGFCPSDETFEVTDAAIDNDPEFIADITVLWTPEHRAAVRSFLTRLSDSKDEPLSEAERDLLEERIDRVRDLNAFRFQVIELEASAEEEQVAEIFVRINSEGVSLKQSDFILTLMSVHWEKGRRALEAFSRAAVDPTVTGPSPRNVFLDPGPDQLLRVAVALAFRRARLSHVYSLLRGKDLETGEVSSQNRDQQFARLESAQERTLDLTHWHEFLKCLRIAGFRGRRMLTSDTAVLYSYAMWLIGSVDFGLDFTSLRPVIARWFFMVHTTSRYSSSAETQFESDLGRIADLPAGDGKAFVAELDRIVNATFTRDYWDITLPGRLDASGARSPALFAYLAALNLLDADALFSDVKVEDLLDPGAHPVRSVERQHLFPKAYLASQGISESRQVNAIANMAFLDWSENAAIADQPPATYWPVISGKVDSGRLQRQAHLHALPIGWEQLDYPTFLERRRTLIARVVQEGFAKLRGKSDLPTASSTQDIVLAGESQTTEFKSTARYNLHTGEVDPKLEHVIVKTVCGFLNAEGGTLIIGVADDGAALGLANDLATLGSKANVDGYELFLRQLLDANLTVSTAGTVRIRFDVLAGEDVCLVTVAPSGKPVFAKPAKGGGIQGVEFWVRIGNATKQLFGDDMVTYQGDRW